MKKSQIAPTLFGLGVLVMVLVCSAVFSQLKAAEARREEMPSQQVVVARTDIPAQARVPLHAITLARISESALPKRPILKVEDAVGKVAAQPIYAGDILLEDRLISPDEVRGQIRAGQPVAAPSLALGRDQVMFVIPHRMVGTFAGESRIFLTSSEAVRRGDYVDVLLTTFEFPAAMTAADIEYARSHQPWDYLHTYLVLQDLPVLNVGRFPRPEDAGSSPLDERHVTVVVDRETALQLKWLKDLIALGQANMDLVVRAPNNLDQVAAQPVSSRDIDRAYGFLANQLPPPGEGGLALNPNLQLPGSGDRLGGLGTTQQSSPGGPGSRDSVLPGGSGGPSQSLAPGGELSAEVPAIPEADTWILLIVGLAAMAAFAVVRRR